MLKVLSEKSKCYPFFETEGVEGRDLIWDYNLISHQMDTSIHPKCTNEVQIFLVAPFKYYQHTT